MAADVYRVGQVVMVPIKTLLPGDSPRLHGEDTRHIDILAETRDALPPILVHRATMRVIDGMHRLRAAALRGDREIAVEYFDGTEDDAFIRAVRDNVLHGLPLSRADREAAVMRIIRSHPEWSDRAIAATAGLSAPTVAAIRHRTNDSPAQSDIRVGMDGRLRPLSSVEGRCRASQIISERPDASLRDVAREAGISLGTAHDVRKRMDRGEDPVPDKHSGKSRNRDPKPKPEQLNTPHREQRADPQATLRMLRNDPSLRFTEAGRSLLHWLGVYVMRDEREQLVNAIPEHCMAALADLAKSCAEIWTQLGEDFERRRRDTA